MGQMLNDLKKLVTVIKNHNQQPDLFSDHDRLYTPTSEFSPYYGVGNFTLDFILHQQAQERSSSDFFPKIDDSLNNNSLLSDSFTTPHDSFNNDF